MAVLSVFDETHTALTLSEISRRSHLPLTTTHRLLGELEKWQAVDRSDDGVYRIGRRLWQLGTLAPVQRELREVALPPMQDLFVATQENVTLAVRSGMSALYIERIHGRASVRVMSRPGKPLPLHATGVGKVLLAHSGATVIDECLASMARITAKTIVDRQQMLHELALVRTNGYAVSREEMLNGVTAVAVPIFDWDGKILAALGLVTRTVRKDLAQLVPALRVAAASISRSIQARKPD